MKRETSSRGFDEEIGFIRSLTPFWLHFESLGYEPRLLTDYRPWLVVFHSERDGEPESWLICTSSACPSDIYGMAAADLPDTLTMEAYGSVNGNDYMVFQA